MNLPLTTMSGTYHNACYDASTPAVGSVEINATPIVIILNDGQNYHFKCSYNRRHHCSLRISPLALKVLFSIFAALYLPYLFLSSLLITAYKNKKNFCTLSDTVDMYKKNCSENNTDYGTCTLLAERSAFCVRQQLDMHDKQETKIFFLKNPS